VKPGFQPICHPGAGFVEKLGMLPKQEKILVNVTTDGLVKAALIQELEQLRDAVRELVQPLAESELWTKPVEPGNSIGNLILHLCGNLNHFVGAQLGGTGYVRDREREFTETHGPAKAKLLVELDKTVAIFRRVVSGLTAEQLAGPHPESRFGPVLQGLVHLVAHFAIHRGQMTYLVRLVKPQPTSPS
jgi:uncharacterized damage-inducible protein DinB